MKDLLVDVQHLGWGHLPIFEKEPGTYWWTLEAGYVETAVAKSLLLSRRCQVPIFEIAVQRPMAKLTPRTAAKRAKLLVNYMREGIQAQIKILYEAALKEGVVINQITLPITAPLICIYGREKSLGDTDYFYLKVGFAAWVAEEPRGVRNPYAVPMGSKIQGVPADGVDCNQWVLDQVSAALYPPRAVSMKPKDLDRDSFQEG